MAAASRSSIKCPTKSISFPSRSHPTTLQIEEMLNNIKVMPVASIDTIYNGLSQLTGLYECMGDLLSSSSTHILMSRQQNKKWVDEVMEESVMLLDVCGGIRDMLSEIKDHSRDLLCALRKRKGDLSIQNSIAKYNCFRKKMKKDVKKLVGSLKQIRGGAKKTLKSWSDDHQLAAVTRAVTGVVDLTISVFNSFLKFLSVPILKPNNRWSIVVSKLMHKGMQVACETQQEHGILNELEGVDAALQRLCKFGSLCEGRNVEGAQCRLEKLGGQIEKIDCGFECVFRCLIRTRASLLNIEIMQRH